VESVISIQSIKISEIKEPSAYEIENKRRIESVNQRLYALIIVFALLASVLVLSLTGVVAFILVRRKNKRAKQNQKPNKSIYKNCDKYMIVKKDEL
jgi:uncharacterized BrkB/YihY/UPF0761 family membrane protein